MSLLSLRAKPVSIDVFHICPAKVSLRKPQLFHHNVQGDSSFPLLLEPHFIVFIFMYVRLIDLGKGFS